MILITGSEGLIGRTLARTLLASGREVRFFDVKRSPFEDVCNAATLSAAVEGVEGVVHLAAVSRVVWAENDPALCERTNVQAIDTLARTCLESRKRPWLISASSREVYGPAGPFPVHEDCAKNPINTYARSKVAGERIVDEAWANGLVGNICRFSSVYGSAHDHVDRVGNAFARAAAFGGNIRVEGSGHTFDFTFVDEVVDGLARLVAATASGERLPPVHFVSGKATTLQELAQIAVRNAREAVTVSEAAPRTFDVAHFVGDPARAKALLGWEARTGIEAGFATLVQRHLAEAP